MYNCVHITINPVLPVSATVTASANPVAAGTAVTFTATPVNGGTIPVYQWKVNGVNAGTNQNTFTYTPVNYDQVSCVVTSNLPCVTSNPATSNIVTMTVSGLVSNVTVTGGVNGGEAKCYNATQTLTVAGGGTTFAVNAGGSATLIAGQNIRFLPGTTVLPGGYMHGYISNVYCGQKAATITMTTEAEEVPGMVVSSDRPVFRLYPNPVTSRFTLEQLGVRLADRVTIELYGMHGERVLRAEMAGRTGEFDVTGLPDGLYFVKVAADGYGETFKLIKTR